MMSTMFKTDDNFFRNFSRKNNYKQPKTTISYVLRINRGNLLEFFFLLSYIHSLRDFEFFRSFSFVNKKKIHKTLTNIFSQFYFLSFAASNNFKGLLLRSHVLHRLKHYQSSLADVDNAIITRPSSYKVSLLISINSTTIKLAFN